MALLAVGVARVVAGQLDPHPEHGGGLDRLRERGIDVELADGELGFRCRQQIEEWRTWVSAGRPPFVTYKVAVSLDGRVRVPGARWVTGEDSRRLVHVLRAQSDAVAVGMGTVRWDNPRLDARDVPVVRQPRRIAFGKGPLPDDSELELPGTSSRGSRAARVRGCAVAPPRGRSDARGRVSGGRPRGQAPRVHRAPHLRGGAGDARRAAAPARAHADGGTPDRQRRG